MYVRLGRNERKELSTQGTQGFTGGKPAQDYGVLIPTIGEGRKKELSTQGTQGFTEENQPKIKAF